MSVWAHVAGIIRVDSIRPLENELDFDKILGKEWDFNDMWDDEPIYTEYTTFPDRFMPCGSEGSLHKHVWINPDKQEMSSYTISVFGDLRDYEDAQSIVDWFEECCDKLWVRQATIIVDISGQKTVNYIYKNKER